MFAFSAGPPGDWNFFSSRLLSYIRDYPDTLRGQLTVYLLSWATDHVMQLGLSDVARFD